MPRPLRIWYPGAQNYGQSTSDGSAFYDKKTSKSLSQLNMQL
jgi:hypothetical protein